MSIINTSLGDNSAVLNYTSGETAQSVTTALVSAISAMGWTVYDTVTAADVVMRALNADGITYKYMRLLVNTTHIYTYVYEDWNEIDHTGTNQSSYSNTSSYTQQLSLSTGGMIYIFANARYAILWSKKSDGFMGSSSQASWCGCMEFSKDISEEVPGTAPVYAWVHGSFFAGMASGTYASAYCPPRLPISNYTAANAHYYSAMTSILGSTFNSSCQLISWQPQGVNPLSPSGFSQVATMYAYDRYQRLCRGRFYGIKLMPANVGSALDKIDIKVDVDLFFDNDAVSETEHIVTTSAYGNSRFAFPA